MARGPRLGPSCLRIVWLGEHARRLSLPPLASGKCCMLNPGGTKRELIGGTARGADGRRGLRDGAGLRERDTQRQRMRWEQRYTEAEPEGRARAQRDRAGTASEGAVQSPGICEDQQWESRNNRTYPRVSCLGTEGGACLAGPGSWNSTDSTPHFLG